MNYTAAVITISDKGSQGLREDTSGPAIVDLITAEGWDCEYTGIIPDEQEQIKRELIKCSDELRVNLVLTTGGTGFSKRDITPEATLQVIERHTPGIPEAMRAESMKITPRGMLSRAEAGIRGNTLIVNLPGSKKAALECLNAVIGALQHGVEMLHGSASECATTGRVLAVCISYEKGKQKHETDSVFLKAGHGIIGDAHAGDTYRQVSLLASESRREINDKVEFKLQNGAFAENIVTEGLELNKLPIGTRLKIGDAVAEITQTGKECNSECTILKADVDCVMMREGIFVKVIEDGEVKCGDVISVL